MKYTLSATISAMIISMIGNTIYFTATHEYHAFEMTKSEPIMGMMILNHVVYAAMMTYLISRFVGKDDDVIKTGMWLGACLGVVMFVPSGLIVRSAWEVPITYFFALDIIFEILLSGLMGITVGWLYKKFNQPAINAIQES